jgi:hypothetical protein
MYAVFDARGRRMVMPRHSRGEAIERIAGAIVGRAASSADKLGAWECLRAQGYRVAWVSGAHAVRAVSPGTT